MKRVSASIVEFFRIGWRRLLIAIQEHAILSFTLILATIISFSSLVFRIAENDQTHTVWRSVVYVLSGIDVDPPETMPGQVAAILTLFSGVLFISLLTGVIASKFSQLMRSTQSVSRKPLRRVFDGHVVLFGWSKKTQAILRQLNADYQAHPYAAEDIIIVSEKENIPRGEDDIYDHVWHVHGAPTDQQALRQANLSARGERGARVACILSDGDTTREEADRRSLLTLLAVEHVQPGAVSLVEVRNPDNGEHFKNAYAEEIFDSSTLGDYILARTAEYPGTAKYIEELLALDAVSAGTEDERMPVSFYVRTAGDYKLSGSTLSASIGELYRRKNILLVGRFHGGELQLFPDTIQGAETPLAENDQLLLICTPECL